MSRAVIDTVCGRQNEQGKVLAVPPHERRYAGGAAGPRFYDS